MTDLEGKFLEKRRGGPAGSQLLYLLRRSKSNSLVVHRSDPSDICCTAHISCFVTDAVGNDAGYAGATYSNLLTMKRVGDDGAESLSRLDSGAW